MNPHRIEGFTKAQRDYENQLPEYYYDDSKACIECGEAHNEDGAFCSAECYSLSVGGSIVEYIQNELPKTILVKGKKIVEWYEDGGVLYMEVE